MIKFIFSEAPFDYENIGEKQEYSVNAEFVMSEDATSDQIFDAVMRLMKIAGYTADFDTFANGLLKYVERYDNWDELNDFLKQFKADN